jgi:hypothetical protein
MNKPFTEFPRLSDNELEKLCRISSAHPLGAAFDRVYNVHIRKTGGTSVNHMFYALGGEATEIDRQLRASAQRVAVCGERVYVWGNTQVIDSGCYFFGASHVPIHQLRLPPRTFVTTTFRDPVDRVVSHYRMVLSYRLLGANRNSSQFEERWLGSGTLAEFMDNMPGDRLFNQLYMFSERRDVHEAADRALRCAHISFLEQFEAGARRLASKTGLPLQPVHERKREVDAPVDSDTLARLRERLKPEYELLEIVRNAMEDR